ncbi:hypothetical protein [Mycolicibacterium tokaiense]|uniref:Uncharacterized protein n=1 Tax=Mycolicibacterium tokaiense TaxID=39695 RepID=A0A378TDB8_9MYCO|nr:hypothetical protein [Mycolicibacterium tokaiense]BBY86687.1 hypothetical protein MTOK_24690 [Mycolicibacterium tokaiense]STZ58808.1 Uncharacterised protein [Mycolicibacterium tokaiense]
MSTVDDDQPITLSQVAYSLVSMTELRPQMAEKFVQDWLADWAQLGEGPSSVVGQLDGETLTRLTVGYMSRYIEYLTPTQQVRFVMTNLPNQIAKDNFQRCMALLIERCADPEAAEVLREACEAAKLLTSDRLHCAVVHAGGLDFAEATDS